MGFSPNRGSLAFITWLLCLAVILLLNSIFDALILTAHVMKAKLPLFGLKLPWYFNLVHAILLAGPLVEMITALLCWVIYREHVGILSSEDFMGIDRDPVGAYGAAGPGPQATGVPEGGAGGSPRRQSVHFEPFSGAGHRLSS